MSRAQLLDALARYAEVHPDESTCVAAVAKLVTEHADCFERHCFPAHVTGSAFVVSRAGDACLLVHHAKLDRWLQPGGHADGESDLLAVARREVLEETGLEALPAGSNGQTGSGTGAWVFDVDVHAIPARGAEPAHWHHDVRYLLVADGARAPVASEESVAAAWFPLGAVEDPELAADDSLKRLARKARRRLAEGLLRGEPR